MFTKIYDQLYRLFRISGRMMIKYSRDPRPASLPYFTGDGLRKIANYIYDDTIKNVVPENVKEKDIIFVGDSNIEKFLKEIHPKIKNKYVLITHNGDSVVNQKYFDLAKYKILKWYGINVTVKDDKVIPLPLGIENKHLFVLGIPLLFNNLRKKNIERKNKIFYGFSVNTNREERQVALDILKSSPHTETTSKWLNMKKYLDLLANYKFVASPPGSCVEGHRTWDALYLNIVPIVKKSITTEYFKKIGLPIWMVSDWHELDNLTENELKEKFDEIRKDFNESAIFIDYWKDKILNLKD